ncbi:SpaA isopeptide-forming pilin-related protein [Enterococcus avium]
MNKKLRNATTMISLMTIVVAFFIGPIISLAATVTNDPVANYSSSWKLNRFGGMDWTDSQVWMKKADGVTAFCIEHGVDLWGGADFTPSELTIAEKDRLSLISYYGYQLDPTVLNYAVTQNIVWEELGDSLLSTTLPNYAAHKNQILSKVNKHNAKPSFNGQSVELNVGDSISLTDSSGVLSNYQHLVENSANLKVEKSGNTLKLTAQSSSKKTGKIQYNIAGNEHIGQSFVYQKSGQQKVATFKLSNGGSFGLNIKVNLDGNIRAKKVDEDTGTALPNAKLKFEYDGKSKEVTTNSSGLAQINDIKAGTKVKVSEVTAPNGYVNKGELKEATIKPNETIEIVLNNKEQLGQVNLTKVGREYGPTMFNQYYKLNGAIYGVYSKDGKKVGSMTTDSSGKASLGKLKLGSYYTSEEKAPEGYLLNTEKIPFELKYAGQTVDISFTGIKATDQEQKGSALLKKEDEKTGEKPQGAATLDGAVYELRRAVNDALIQTVTIKNGEAKVTNIPLDDYYWIEKVAPEGYQLDKSKLPFKIAYAGQTVEVASQRTIAKEKVITGGFDLIKFGNYDWKDKKVKIKPLKDVEFSVTSDTTKKVVAIGKTDIEGYLKFTDLPYDTYTVKEIKTPEGYEIIKPFKISVKTQNETHHYALENKVIEEKLKVSKVDEETGKTVPRSDAGFKIKNKQTDDFVVMPNLNDEGTTDTFFTNEKGFLILSEALSYGNYELIEVQAPEGYIIAKDSIPFKVDGSHNGLIEIKFKDKSQKGVAFLTKHVKKPLGIDKKESKYGHLYKFVFDDQKMPGVTFDIEAATDIITNDGTVRAKKGDIVATMTTDEKGECMTPPLYLGKYQAVEKFAPSGVVVDTKPIPFELKYVGQLVELTSTSLTVHNEFQSLLIKLQKNQEAVDFWENNLPGVVEEEGIGQVFGIFTRDEKVLSNEISVPANSLVGFTEVIKGIATFDLQLPEGKYYVKELDAGEAHTVDETEYDFTFEARDNQVNQEIEIWKDRVLYGKKQIGSKVARTPIVNKLHFNEFQFKKVNEKATLAEEGYLFEHMDKAEGVVFSLEDEESEVIQTIKIDEDSIGTVKNLPVGTFYLKEKKASSDRFILSDQVIKIMSTKDGIQAFSEDGEELTHDLKKAEILFEIKNDLIKGIFELTKKDVSTGELLPDTGIQVLDQNEKTIIEGRTNENGVFTFENLPKGKYFFKEYDAPEGYLIDESLHEFEIKEQGEIVKCEMTNKKEEIPEVEIDSNGNTPQQISKKSLPQTGEMQSIGLVLLGACAVVGGILVYWIKKKRTLK